MERLREASLPPHSYSFPFLHLITLVRPTPWRRSLDSSLSFSLVILFKAPKGWEPHSPPCSPPLHSLASAVSWKSPAKSHPAPVHVLFLRTHHFLLRLPQASGPQPCTASELGTKSFMSGFLVPAITEKRMAQSILVQGTASLDIQTQHHFVCLHSAHPTIYFWAAG